MCATLSAALPARMIVPPADTTIADRDHTFA
jgi:hypothetical protein